MQQRSELEMICPELDYSLCCSFEAGIVRNTENTANKNVRYLNKLFKLSAKEW